MNNGIDRGPLNYLGKVVLGSECVEVAFQVPSGATAQECDAALLGALSQVAQVELLCIGSASPAARVAMQFGASS